MKVITLSLVILAIWIEASNGDVIYKDASFISDGQNSSPDNQYAFGYNKGKLYHATQPKTMAILDLAMKKWSMKEFSADTDMSSRQYTYFSLNSTFFLFQGPRKVANGSSFDATMHFWNEMSDRFEPVSIVAKIPAVDFDTSYMVSTVPDPRGNIVYVASSIYSRATSKVIVLKIRVDFGAAIKANVDSISSEPLALEGNSWVNVGCLSHYNDTLYTFVRQRPAGVWLLDLNNLYKVDLRSNTPAITKSPLDVSNVRLYPYFDAYLIKQQIFVFGQEFTADDKKSAASMWSFHLNKGRWNRIDFTYPTNDLSKGQMKQAAANLPANDFHFWYSLDQISNDLYLKAFNNTVFIAKPMEV